jgi:16S rRNA (guanine1207-N2)-methyltransferase
VPDSASGERPDAPLDRPETADEAAGDHYFTAQPASPGERRTITVWLAERELTVETAGGVFSSYRVDHGTRALLGSVPPPPATGDMLDLGCGWGPIALSLALASPAATVWAVDVNERALDLMRRNAERLGLGNIRAVTPDEVPDDVSFAAVWSNPPIRVGKSALHEMLSSWLRRLAPHASAHLVVQRNLGADSLQRWLADELGEAATVTRADTVKGFRVLRVDATGTP